jgi:chromosome segregation ATPase
MTLPHISEFFDSISDPSDKEESMKSLTDLLRQRDAEIQALRQEKAELQNQLMLRGNPINLDQAYADLLAHLKKREAEFHTSMAEQVDRQRSLEREIRKLKDTVHASRKVIEDQETNIALMDGDASEKLNTMQHQLEAAMKENQEKSQNIMELENMVECLTIEAERNDEERIADKALIDRFTGLVEKFERGQDELECMNEEMQNRLDTLRRMIEDKEAELRDVERSCDERKGELLDDSDRMRRQLNEIIANQRYVLESKEEEIHLLKMQVCKYEDIIDEAEYVTQEQRFALMENKREIEKLSSAIERVQNTGLLSQLDKMWCGSSNVDFARMPLPQRRDEY